MEYINIIGNHLSLIVTLEMGRRSYIFIAGTPRHNNLP